MVEKQKTTKEGILKTDYGYDLIWSNTDDYCGKILVFEKAGNKTSLLFHKERKKSFFVNSGEFILRYIDTQTAEMKDQILREGDVWKAPILTPHQLECRTDDASITEVGTCEIFYDIYYVSKN
jgi:mannose-6-phosphate isomerase-like protein (cupin superfamily)